MKIVFVSNFLNHHQIPLCEELRAAVEEFYFIATDNGDSQGYQVSEKRDYLIDYQKDSIRAKNEIMSADAVVFGACPEQFVEWRMKENKLSFIYSERVFKKGMWHFLRPKNLNMLMRRYLNHKKKNLYVLAASAFLPYELSVFGFPRDKVFKWGYFPNCKVDTEYEKQPNTILCAGRMLDWKHMETVIECARLLKQDSYKFKAHIVGEGPEKENLSALIDKYELNDYVSLLGSKSHDELLKLMQKSSIYMFTSDFKEGWGAVANEAMANGCAVVASSAAGATPFLISHNDNGLIYKYGKNENAYQAVKLLFDNPKKAKKIGEKAKQTINNDYNYNVAAERFLYAVDEFYSDNKITHAKTGVLSPVKIISNDWFKG